MDDLTLVYKNGSYMMRGDPALVNKYGAGPYKTIDEVKKAYAERTFGIADYNGEPTVVFIIHA